MIWCRNGPTGRYVYHKVSQNLSRYIERAFVQGKYAICKNLCAQKISQAYYDYL